MNIKPLIDATSTECADRLATCRADVISLRERLRLTAQILAEEVGARGPANADDLARIAVAELARMRAENDRYRAALVEIVGDAAHFDTGISLRVKQIAINALATRTESGQLSDDSGPIAGDFK